ncbi:MAG: phage tail tape measure protein [Chloroflexota bacterium]|nr:phage tail tape measure protein [Chloroflexota bacterium]
MGSSTELGKAIFSLETDSTKFDAGIAKAEEKTGKLGGTFGKLGAAGKVAVGVVGGTMVGALSDFARAAADDEANAAKLEQAINNSGVAFEDYTGSIDAAIKKGQDLAFSDDATRNSLASLTESTGSVDEAMKRLPVAMDLARAKGISLEAAAKLLGKVSDENTTSLKKYGIVMDEGATATDVLAKVQQVAGGQAEVYGKSTKGSIDKVKDSIGEFTEGIGASLGPAQGLIALLPGVSGGMSIAGGAVGGLSTLIKGGMIPSFLATIPATLAMMVPFLPLILIVGGIALAIGLLALAWSNNWGDIQGKTKVAVDFLLDIFDGFKILMLTIWKGIVTGVANAINGVLGVINGFIDAYNGVAEKLGLPLIGKIELVTPNLKDIDKAIDDVTADRTARIHVTYDMPQPLPGQRSGPFASGTDHITRGPELFLAGEAGPERVQVTPLAHGIGLQNPGAAGAGVTINVATLVVREEADIQRIAAELEALRRSNARAHGVPTPASPW